MPKKTNDPAKVNVEINSKINEKRSRSSRFDFRWPLLFLTIVIAIAVTLAMNLNKIKTDSSKFENAIQADNGDLEINWNRYPTTDIELTDSTVTITESGTYHITGSTVDGNIVISASEYGEIRLILDNVNMTHGDNPVIYCHKASDLVIELVGENTISKTSGSVANDEDIIGAIFANADLTFQGDGVLNLTSDTLDGIIGKDDLKFISGTYNIDAADDGIRGRDSVYIVNGNFNINAAADAIKTTNDIDPDKGFILIEDGNFNLKSSTAKGLKATKTILAQNGNFVIDTYDDAIHSDNYVGIASGTFNIVSTDDGIHADSELIIDGGNININKAYEGIEAQVITINDGIVSVISNDDGINAGGGADKSAINRTNPNMFNTDENCILSINGGEIYVNAAGDGVDSNGWLYFNGGKVIIDGPTNNGNGALDSGMGIVMNGGEVIAVGSSGMAGTLGSSSSVNNISVYFSTTQPADTKIEIKNSNGETAIAHTATKTFSHLSAGTDHFTLGGTYTIFLNDEEYTNFTITGITTTVGGNNMNRQKMPRR